MVKAGRVNGPRSLSAGVQWRGLLRGFGRWRPQAIAAAYALSLLSACAVGPNFKVPPAPEGAGYTPEAHPAPAVASDGGAAQWYTASTSVPGGTPLKLSVMDTSTTL